MKNYYLWMLAALFILSACTAPSQTESTDTTVKTSQMTASETDTEKQLRHVVLFKFKDESTAEQVKEVEDAFRALATKIPAIRDFEWGTNNSPEGLNEEFTHCFLVTFSSEEDREVYLPHPDHMAFVDVLKPHLDKVLVVDYWAGE